MRIALIAMSGLRALDPELLRIGLTLPGFVARSRVIAALPSLGLLTLAGQIPPEHHVTYHEVPDLRVLGGGHQDALPADLPAHVDLVAISSFTAQIGEAYALADRCRARGMTVVLGGPHVSVLPDEAAEHADAVIIGEGDLTWPTVLADAAAGRLSARYGRRGAAFPLADAPMPRFELLDLARYDRFTVQTSRGCPHRCEFCAATPLMSPGYRQKPIDRILAEIDRIIALAAPRRPFLEFADDNSIPVAGRAHWRALLPQLAERRVRWFTETDLSIADDPDLLRALRRAGCVQLLIGLEAPAAADLVGIDRAGWKQARAVGALAAIRRIQAHGISVNGCFITGLDTQDASCFEAVERFAIAAGLAEIQVTLPTAFPGTPLYDRWLAEGRLLAPHRWEACTLFDVHFRPRHMTAEALAAGFRGLIARLYTADAVRARRRAFRAAAAGWRTA